MLPGFDDIAHKDGEDPFGLVGVGFVELDLEQRALGRVHGGLEELLGVHFTKTFEALDLHAAFANFHDLVEDAGDAEDGMGFCMVAFAFDDFKQRLVLTAEVIDMQAEFVELLELTTKEKVAPVVPMPEKVVRSIQVVPL